MFFVVIFSSWNLLPEDLIKIHNETFQIAIRIVVPWVWCSSFIKSLILQAEHGPDSQVVLVIAGDGVNVDAILAEVSKQCDSLPRGEFASKALSHSFVVFARDMVEVGH